LNNLEQKGQAVFIDLLIGIILFFLVMAAAFIILDNQTTAVIEQQQTLSMQTNSETVLAQLVSGTGQTIDANSSWELYPIDQVKFIGLALTDRVILPEKINKFKEFSLIDYNKTKEKIMTEKDFFFRLVVPGTGDNGTTMKGCPDETSDCAIGKNQAELETEGKKIDSIIVQRRIVAFKGDSAIVEMTFFKEK
jgi:hypothetical protein